MDLSDIAAPMPRRGPERLESAVDGARLWGMELEPRWRVLAVTFEPTAAAYQAAWGAPASDDDRRVQVLCHPVSTILASLRRTGPDAAELLAFEEAQLVDVVAALDGPTVRGPLFGQPEPRPGSWGPRFSLEGRSSAPDGTSRTVVVAVDGPDGLHLDVFARFDVVECRDAAGQPLAVD